MTKETLWATQLLEYPNSIVQTVDQALRWPEYDQTHTDCTRKECADSHKGWFDSIQELRAEYDRYIREQRLANQLQTARSVACALADSIENGTPILFYLCGPGLNDPVHAVYRGCRYGIHGHEYISGWPQILGKDMQ